MNDHMNLQPANLFHYQIDFDLISHFNAAQAGVFTGMMKMDMIMM